MISQTHTWPSRALEPPHCHGMDSAELWMGRRIRTDVPQIPKLFIPNWPRIKHFRELDKKYKVEQKCGYDNLHNHCQFSQRSYQFGWKIKWKQVPGEIVHQANAPRSYLVETPTGQVCQNQSHIRPWTENYQVP